MDPGQYAVQLQKQYNNILTAKYFNAGTFTTIQIQHMLYNLITRSAIEQRIAIKSYIKQLKIRHKKKLQEYKVIYNILQTLSKICISSSNIQLEYYRIITRANNSIIIQHTLLPYRVEYNQHFLHINYNGVNIHITKKNCTIENETFNWQENVFSHNKILNIYLYYNTLYIATKNGIKLLVVNITARKILFSIPHCCNNSKYHDMLKIISNTYSFLLASNNSISTSYKNYYIEYTDLSYRILKDSCYHFRAFSALELLQRLVANF